MLVHLIADFGYGDLAFAEVVQQLRLALPEAEPVLTPVPPFATLAAGFCIGQLGLREAAPGTLIYHNVAPREDDAAARADNAGERLAYARLPTGVLVIGANAGYTFSFIRDAALEICWAAVSNAGSQFRSRDLFPRAIGAIIQKAPGALTHAFPLAAIPTVPHNRVAYIDGYGNIKTTLAHGTLTAEPGTPVRVRIGEHEHEAILSDGSFAVPSGQLALAPGSSGWSQPTKPTVRWMELFLRGGNASVAFGCPSIDQEIVLKERSDESTV